MGSLFSTPKMPQKSQEQIDAERQAKLQAKRDIRDAEDRAADEERKRKEIYLAHVHFSQKTLKDLLV